MFIKLPSTIIAEGQPSADEPRRASVSSRADGSIALLGSSSTTRPALTRHTFWRWLNQSATRLMFVLADGRGDAIGIEVMGPTDSLPELVEILDD